MDHHDGHCIGSIYDGRAGGQGDFERGEHLLQDGRRHPVIMMCQNRQQDIDRKAAENDYRINVKAELDIELLHEKIDQLRECEVLDLKEAVRMLTELLDQSASGARESDAEGRRPS